jgi:hypothetical protein
LSKRPRASYRISQVKYLTQIQHIRLSLNRLLETMGTMKVVRKET